MNTTIIITIYLIGCILSYGRFTALHYNTQEEMGLTHRMKYKGLRIIVTVFSWIGFLAGLLNYTIVEEKYFFKWSLKPLFKQQEDKRKQSEQEYLLLEIIKGILSLDEQISIIKSSGFKNYSTNFPPHLENHRNKMDKLYFKALGIAKSPQNR